MRARAADGWGNGGDWTESGPVTIIPHLDEDGDPIGNVWYVHQHPKPAGWSDEKWAEHLQKAGGRTWTSAFHYLGHAAQTAADGDAVVCGRGEYLDWGPGHYGPFRGVTLRSVASGDAATRAATRFPFRTLMLRGPRCKVLGLTVLDAHLVGRATARDTAGNLAADSYDDTDNKLAVVRCEGSVRASWWGSGVYDVEIVRSKLTSLSLDLGSRGGRVKTSGNSFTGDATVDTYTDLPGSVKVDVIDNATTGASLVVVLRNWSSDAGMSPGAVTIKSSTLEDGGISCEGIPGPASARVTGDEVSQAPSYGLQLKTLSPLTVSDNRIATTGERGIYVCWCGKKGQLGKVFGNEVRDCPGGGMLVQDSWADVHHNTLASNGGDDVAGGGIGVEGWPYDLVVRANQILDNLGSGGGGVAVHGSCALHDNTIRGNRGAQGGGVCVGNSWGEGELRANQVLANQAVEGGGVFYQNGFWSNPGAFCENAIQENTADRGGGVWVCGGSVVRNLIERNHARGSGGGVYVAWDTVTVEPDAVVANNVIAGNTAVSGGGVCYGDGFWGAGRLDGGATDR